MFLSLLGSVVVPLALLKLAFLLASYLMGDVREVAARPSRSKKYRPAMSVVIDARIADKIALRKCLQSVYGNTYHPREVIVIAARGATTLRRTYKNLRVVKGGEPTAVLRQYAKGSIGVLVDADTVLERTALQNGALYFRNRKIKAVVADVVAAPAGSLLRAVVCWLQIIWRHAARALPRAATAGSGRVVFCRHAAAGETKALSASGVYAHRQSPISEHQLVRWHLDYLAGLWILVDLAATAVVLHVYGMERGLIMLSFVAALLVLLAGVAILNYRGLGVTDRISLFLLTPWAYAVFVIRASISLICYILRKIWPRKRWELKGSAMRQ